MRKKNFYPKICFSDEADENLRDSCVLWCGTGNTLRSSGNDGLILDH